MTTFETLLDRLARHRGWSGSTVAEIAGGDANTPAALRRLAPALGWRTVDLFALAQQPLPDDLAPTDWQADPGSLIWEMAYLPPARPVLLAAARSPPLLPRTESPPRPADLPDVPEAAVGWLMRGRNLERDSAAKLLLVAGGPYLSGSTVHGICLGDEPVDARIVNGFAHGLGIPVADFAALYDVDVTDVPTAPECAAEVAAMVWECRRLTREQIDQLRQLGHELRHRCADGIPESKRCRCQEPSGCDRRPHPGAMTTGPCRTPLNSGA